MVRFQIPTWEWLNFIDQKLFEYDFSVIFYRFLFCQSNIYLLLKILQILKNLVFGKLLTKGIILANDKILVDGELFSVGKHLVDTKHWESIKMVTDLIYQTDLPDLPIDEKLGSIRWI